MSRCDGCGVDRETVTYFRPDGLGNTFSLCLLCVRCVAKDSERLCREGLTLQAERDNARLNLEAAQEKIEALEDRLKTEPKRGAEAEELRAGIENLIERGHVHDDECDLLDRMQRLLDRVDARDSLSILEKYDAAQKALKLCVTALEGHHDVTLVTHAVVIARRCLEATKREP